MSSVASQFLMSLLSLTQLKLKSSPVRHESLCFVINIIVVDDLVTYADGASAGMVYQRSFWVWAQPMRAGGTNYVTPLIGQAHVLRMISVYWSRVCMEYSIAYMVRNFVSYFAQRKKHDTCNSEMNNIEFAFPVTNTLVAALFVRYRQVSNIRCTLVGNKIVDHSDVVGAAPVGAAPTTSSFSTSTSGFKGFGKDSRKMVRESFKCLDLVQTYIRDLTIGWYQLQVM